MSSQGAPRKFAEKIAIMERKLNEDEDAFSQVMREVRAITTSAVEAPAPTLQPGQWNRPSGSLPNMHEHQQYWPEANRGRSPGAHYHPYRSPRVNDRVPPLHAHMVYPPPPHQHLQPPDQWSVFGRARSDPAIHHTPMSPVGGPYMSPMMPFEHSGSMHIIPNMDDSRNDLAIVGSLPNMHSMPTGLPPMPEPSCYHAQVGQRHSTGCGTRLAPSYTPESQSAPTSPAQLGECALPPSWPVQRHFSNSPEALDIPNIVLTGADGAEGGRLEYDQLQDPHSVESIPYDVRLQDLHLETLEPMCNGSSHDTTVYQ